MATDDEEWESAEIQLKSLEIAAPVVMPPAAPLITLPVGGVPVIAIVERKEAIDDVLITALDNPRERLFVLQTEDLMLKYVKSSDSRHIDLPPGYNSFRRLLTYRLAKRFGLNHTSSDHPIETERIIRLTKTMTTCIPFPLLIKYRRDFEDGEDTATSKGGESPFSKEDSSTPTSEPPKKVMLMKRRTDGGFGGSAKSNAARPQQSAEDREKAYKEARERIFGAEVAAATAAETGKDSVITPVETSTRVSSTSPSIPEAASVTLPIGKSTSGTAINERAVSSGSPTLRETTSNNSNEKVKRSISASQLSTSPKKGVDVSNTVLTGKERRTVDTTNWREKKGQIRDVETERFDPDFNRGSSGRGRNSGRYYYSPAEEFAQQELQQQMHHQLPLAPSLGDYNPPVTAAVSYNPAWSYAGGAYPPQYDPYGQVIPPPPSLQTPPINSYYDVGGQWVASPGGQSGAYDPNYYTQQQQQQHGQPTYYDPQLQQQHAYYGYSNPSPHQQYYQQQPPQYQQQQQPPPQQQQQQYSRGSSRGNDPRNEQFPPLR